MDRRGLRAAATVAIALAVTALAVRFVLHGDRPPSRAAPASRYVAVEGARGIRGLSSGADFALAVGDEGAILRCGKDQAWTPEASPTHATLRAVAQRLDEATAVGDDGTIVERTGGAWRVVASPTKRTLRAVAYSAYGTIAVGDGGTVVRRAAPGEPWVLEASGTSNDLEGLCAGLSAVWAVGDRVVVSRTLMGWKTFEPAPRVTLHAVDCDDRSGLAVGDDGTLLERSGGAWQDVPSPTHATLLAVSAPIGTASWLVVGKGGVVLRAGALEPSGVEWDLRAVTEGPFGTFVGGEGGLLRRR